MKKSMRVLVLIAIVLALGAWAAAQSTAKDPICGMNVQIEGAKHTAAYEGKTYYFCAERCKTEFLKNPAKYAGGKASETAASAEVEGCGAGCAEACDPQAAKAGEAALMAPAHAEAMKGCPKMAPGCCCCGMRGMGMMRHGMRGRMGMGRMMAAHGLMMEMGDVAVENTADGVVIKITSKDPEKVKKIQEHAAACKARAGQTPQAGCCGKPCAPAEAAKEK